MTQSSRSSSRIAVVAACIASLLVIGMTSFQLVAAIRYMSGQGSDPTPDDFMGPMLIFLAAGGVIGGIALAILSVAHLSGHRISRGGQVLNVLVPFGTGLAGFSTIPTAVCIGFPAAIAAFVFTVAYVSVIPPIVRRAAF